MKPHYVQVRPEDNVAIIVNPEGLPAGTAFDSGLSLNEAVPHANKVALLDISSGQPIRRYGAVIGYAERDIPAGTWVREDLVRMPEAPSLESLALATEVPAPPEPLEGYTFEGFRNRDGSVGTKNILGLATTVQCVAPTVEHAIARIRTELLPRYSNVDDVISVSHAYGCGVAIDAPDAAIPIRSIGRLARHPNLGGEPLVVSLGCEKMQPDRLLPQSQLVNASKGLPPVLELQPYVMRLQDEELRGFGSMVEAIMRFAERRLTELDARRRVTCPAADLVVGVQCGGSDALSGVTANPTVGFAADLLVRAGASVMFSEVTEIRDAVHLLTPRCATEDIARDLIREMRWYDDYLARGKADRSANTTPGNKRGGLANIVEKALGSVAKSGTMALTDVISHGEKVRSKGLTFAATPAGDFVCGTQQLAAGMNLHIFTTGRGTPYGLAMAPVIKVSSNTALAERWYDLIDLDAGRIASGEATIEQVGWELFRLMLDVASGRKKVWTDHWGLHNALSPFNPGPVT
ncbi:MAG: galactarate dehydratase [Acidobacteria bacterium]|nr:galactarate dehydratase [Acidobacteriota bacterium]MDA1233803.1 galactarate dehydratase [Acidobacteriota bacterium]